MLPDVIFKIKLINLWPMYFDISPTMVFEIMCLLISLCTAFYHWVFLNEVRMKIS